MSKKHTRGRKACCSEALWAFMEKCILCPRKCKVNRLLGETGFCALTDKLVTGGILPHFGEEPPISGQNGAGTIFFSSCNLRCIFCQNFQISHSPSDSDIKVDTLADCMLDLQRCDCHNIEAVTPTPQLPLFLDALDLAYEKGLDLPVVYNCGGYENPEIIQILDGTVDIYLPDFKYGNEEDAFLFSGARDYPVYALSAIREMIRQCGDDLILDGEIATKGVVIRHLVLPGKIRNSFEVLDLIAGELSKSVPVSIMSQYTPVASVEKHPLLGRRITANEYEAVVEYALDLGFETIFTQEVDESDLIPDFDKEEPFSFKG